MPAVDDGPARGAEKRRRGVTRPLIVGSFNKAKLKEMMSDKNILLIDVREPQELAPPLPALKDSINIPLNKLIANPGQVPKGKKIVIVCRSGRRSMIAAQALFNSGYNTIYNLEGGLLGYYGD